MKPRRNSSMAIIVSIILLLVFVCNVTVAVGATKTLDVVLDDTYPPYIFYDGNGQPQGILVDQWKLFEKKTGIKVTLHPMAWNEAQAEMKQGKYDVIDTMFYSTERDKSYDFTQPYETIETVIFFHDSISGITNLSSLKGFAVGVKGGDYAYTKLIEAGINPGDLKIYTSYQDIVAEAAKGDVKIFVMDLPPGLYYLNKYQIFDQYNYSEPIYTGAFRRAVTEGDAKTLAAINEGFAKIPESQLAAIKTKWFGNQVAGFQYWIQVFVGLGALLLVVIIIIVWNYLLRRKVKRHTASLSKALSKLQMEQSKLQALVSSMPDLIYIIDQDGFILEYLSPGSSVDALADPENVLNKNLAELFDPRFAEQLRKEIQKARLVGQSDSSEFNFRMHGGDKQYYELRFASLNDNKILAVARNITERALATQQIINLSILDKLTNVYNRNHFEQIVGNWKNPMADQVGLFMVDIDGLKLINDTLGHGVGDQYLQHIALALKQVFPNPAVISRIGGDEFAIIVKAWDESKMLIAKDKLIDEMRSLNKKGFPIPFSISIGFSSATPSCNTINDMMKCADDYMYRQKLFHRQSQRGKTIQTLSAMLSERDFITQGHSHRMSHYIKELARRVHFPDSQLPAIELFADFHDIGKIGISDVILFKPDKLDEKEFADMKRHAEIGFRIAEASPDLAGISEWVYKHHENWDGTGYPFGLKGEEIPLACRMLTIVDAYDAMTNDRPYRKAMDKEAAVLELRRCAGTQFDPELIQVFIEIVTNNEMEVKQ